MATTVSTRPIPAKGIGTHSARDYVRLTGDAEHVQLETAQRDYFGSKDTKAFAPEAIAADVTVDRYGIVTVDSDYLEPSAAHALASEYRRALLDARVIEPEPGKRYTVGKFSDYIVLDRVSADQLASHLKLSIKDVADAEIVHGTDKWVYWSDGKLTKATGLPKWTASVKALSENAEDIITMWYGSDSPRLHVGLENVLRMEEITSRHSESVTHDGGIYAPKRVERLTVHLRDGSTATWWLHTVGYVEGYAFDLYPSREALEHDLFPPPKAPATPPYTPMTGQLWEPCPRCGAEPVYMPLHLCESCWPTP